LRVKAPYKLVEPLTAEQVKAFIRSLRRYRDLAIVYLMLFCGLRSGELLSLRLSDLSDEERRLRVRGKGNRERALPLPNVLVAVISDYLRLERPARAPTSHLFVVLQGRRRGHPMTRAGLRSLFRHRRLSRKKIRNANAHRFRHTFGADMARAGVRLPILQRMMGHADGKTTLQYINLSMTDIAAEYTRATAAIEKRYGGES
jgi:integrase